MSRVTTALVAIAFVLAAPQASAWGPDGHRIVARIALAHLSPEARQQVDGILDGDPQDFVEASNWADQVRPDRPETYNWHFVDVPHGIYAFDPARDCPPTDGGDCVLAAIGRLRQTLGDPTAGRARRAEALKYLIHFVGDLHQPLHSITNNDRGGNDVRVNLGGEQPSNLHAVWDRAILARRGLSDAQYAGRLLAELAQSPLDPGPLDPLAWVLESHARAETYVYDYPEFVKDTPPPAPIRLAESYWQRAAPVVDERLTLGGLRLAALLNDTLAK
ncbi:MAG TPA: S1/P1 nuclease [Vicinamibacterales bacterium]|nr:S1/P1 nuclease [Vicinamibacterales bacterium]